MNVRWRDESGIALVSAILAVLILGGLAGLFVATAVSQHRATSRQRDFEGAIHVAEGGADAVVAQINREEPCGPGDPDYVTCRQNAFITSGPGGDHAYEPPTGLTDAQLRAWEEAWAIDLAMDAYADDPDDLDHTNRGDAFGIRPTDGSGSSCDAGGNVCDFVFGVGFVPSAADPVRTRVIKLQFDRNVYQPTIAVLTNGPIKLGGAVDTVFEQTSPNQRVVHTNSDAPAVVDMDFAGKTKIDAGIMSAAGDVDTPCPAQLTCAPDSPEEVIPDIRGIDLYELSRQPELLTASGDSTNPTRWWDLCVTAGVGSIRAPGGTPCAGQACTAATPCTGGAGVGIVDAPADLGWQYVGARNEWSDVGGGIRHGAYFVHLANAELKRTNTGTTRLTVIAMGSTTDLGATGNVKVSGGGVKASPAVSDLMLAADRDIVINGGSEMGVPNGGLFVTGEQFSAEGGSKVYGAVIAQDRALHDPNVADTVNSAYHGTNNLGGSFSILFRDLNVPIQAIVRITDWNEL